MKDLEIQKKDLEKHSKEGVITTEHRMRDLQKWEDEMRRDLAILLKQKAELL